MNKCAKVIFQMILFLIISESYAAPAYPYKIYVNLETGDSVEIFMRGDEFLKYAISSDGYTLLNDSKVASFPLLTIFFVVLTTILVIYDEIKIAHDKNSCQVLFPFFIFILTGFNQAS